MGNRSKMEKMVTQLDALKEFYRGKRIFLTGHTGFKGTWMLLMLKELGAIVKGYSLDPEERSIYNYIKADELCDSAMADIRHAPVVKKEMENFQPDVVFHFAAQAIVRDSYVNPIYTFDTNCLGTVNVLDSLRFIEKPCIAVLVTTDKVYENLEVNTPYKEDDKLGGYDPYSASKACAEIAISSYIRSFFNKKNIAVHHKKIASARAGNVIGGGDWSKDRIIPDLIRSIELNETLKVRNPDSIRPWQHVLEPLTGYLVLAMQMDKDYQDLNTSYNFGPETNDVLTVKELVELAINRYGRGRYEFIKEEGAVHEAGLLKLDITKALNDLNWKPSLNSTKSIELTIDWYKNYQGDATTFTIRQIRNYLNGIF